MPLRLAAVAVIVAVRLVALNTDPPPWLSWSTGLFTDEGFYTLDARHEALFGHAAPGNFHDRLLSPLLSLLQQGVFALFGPRLLAARLLSTAFGLLTLVVFRLGLRRVRGAHTADLAVLFLGLAPPFAFSNRSALQETPTVFWLVLAFTFWAYGWTSEASKKSNWLLRLSGVAFGLAIVFKPLALLALPAFAWAWGKAAPSRLAGGSPPSPFGKGEGQKKTEKPCPNPPPLAGEDGEPQRAGRGLLGFGIVLLLSLLLWYEPHHAELARMATFYRGHQMQPHSWGSVWLNVRRGLIGGERGVVPYLLALMPVPCLLAGWGIARRGDRATRLLTLWLLCGLAFCLLSSYAPSRYYVLFLPPLAALAAQGTARLHRAWQTAVVGLFLVTSLPWYAQAWTHRTYARQAAASALAHALPPGSVVVGEFAPALCLDTDIAAAPVQPGLSNDGHPVERLHAGYVCVTRVPVWEGWWRTRYPTLIQPSHRLMTFTLGGNRQYVVDVYAVRLRSP